VHGFNWPPSSPDLNPIKRIWRYIKEKLKQLPYVITTKKELKREIQRIWNKINPRNFRHYIEHLIYIIEDIIKVKGDATIN
jgi:transposase